VVQQVIHMTRVDKILGSVPMAPTGTPQPVAARVSATSEYRPPLRQWFSVVTMTGTFPARSCTRSRSNGFSDG